MTYERMPGASMETGMDLNECLIGGYIYNPEVGDPSGGDPTGCKIF